MNKILEAMKHGGSWLGAARSWLQWHKINGSRVTWGSNDVLEPPFTVHDAEEIARHAAAAARQEALLEAADLIEGKENRDNWVAIELRKRATG
jgi:hypothetical protein